MKSTGYIRRIDLSRITIPPSITKELKIYSGDPLEFFIHDDCIVIKKYVPEKERCSLDK